MRHIMKNLIFLMKPVHQVLCFEFVKLCDYNTKLKKQLVKTKQFENLA